MQAISCQNKTFHLLFNPILVMRSPLFNST
nr:MAG TPA: hypothetical protein [Caudoviricetes sp.]